MAKSTLIASLPHPPNTSTTKEMHDHPLRHMPHFSFIAIVCCNLQKLNIRLSDRNFNYFVHVKVLSSTLTSQLIIAIMQLWLLAHAAVSKSVILFLVLVLFRTYLIHAHMYQGVPEIESTKVGRWKTFLWLYKSSCARGRRRKG